MRAETVVKSALATGLVGDWSNAGISLSCASSVAQCTASCQLESYIILLMSCFLPCLPPSEIALSLCALVISSRSKSVEEA